MSKTSVRRLHCRLLRQKCNIISIRPLLYTSHGYLCSVQIRSYGVLAYEKSCLGVQYCRAKVHSKDVTCAEQNSIVPHWAMACAFFEQSEKLGRKIRLNLQQKERSKAHTIFCFWLTFISRLKMAVFAKNSTHILRASWK